MDEDVVEFVVEVAAEVMVEGTVAERTVVEGAVGERAVVRTVELEVVAVVEVVEEFVAVVAEVMALMLVLPSRSGKTWMLLMLMSQIFIQNVTLACTSHMTSYQHVSSIF